MQRRVQARRTRTTRTLFAATAFTVAAIAMPGRALAQAPQAPAPPPGPPPVWTGSFGAGLAVTSGNTDTSNVNLAAKTIYDPRNPHLATFEALYLHGSSEGETTVNRTALTLRDDYSLTDRLSVFGRFGYLQDEFKGIDYLISPTAGVGYKVVNLERTKFMVDTGAGVVWEKDSVLGTVDTSGAVTAGENFRHQLTGTTLITHAATALWKTADFGDALYTVSAGLATTMTRRTQLKLEVLELYKTKPPIGKESQDVSFIMSVVYSF
jgi:putative salt-induced outer membrane protein YdiY